MITYAIYLEVWPEEFERTAYILPATLPWQSGTDEKLVRLLTEVTRGPSSRRNDDETNSPPSKSNPLARPTLFVPVVAADHWSLMIINDLHATVCQSLNRWRTGPFDHRPSFQPGLPPSQGQYATILCSMGLAKHLSPIYEKILRIVALTHACSTFTTSTSGWNPDNALLINLYAVNSPMQNNSFNCGSHILYQSGFLNFSLTPSTKNQSQCDKRCVTISNRGPHI